MKKKLLSILTASAMAVSAAAALQLSAAAFTLNSTYDQVKINNNFNTESNTGAPDGTNYKISDGSYKLWNGLAFSSRYYASVDFMFTADGQKMESRNKDDGGNYGPNLNVSGTNFRNSISSNVNLYTSFNLNQWYKLELEGRMTVTGAKTYLSLYDYKTNTQVVDSVEIGLRNFDNKSCGWFLLSDGVCFDNEYAVAEWADEVIISQEDSITAIDAGGALQLAAVARRAGSTDNLTQPVINWSVADVKSGEESYFTIADGRLTVNAQASTQTIKVVATAATNGNPYGEYPVTINAIDLTSSKFDTITVSGDATVAAGSNVQYSYTASKSGSDVTSSLSDSDVVWSVVDSTGARVLGNKYITISNGLLTVNSAVVGQNINVRAANNTGAVYVDYPVTITTTSDERVWNYNACEDAVSNGKAKVVSGSWDGSSYYIKDSDLSGNDGDFLGQGTFGTTTSGGDVLIVADIKFEADGAGFTTVRNDGGQGLWLRRNGGNLAVQTGGSSYTQVSKNGSKYALDANSWYHIEIMFDQDDNKINIWKYDENGNKTNKATFTKDDGFKQRNSNGFNRIKVEGNTGIDNYMVIEPRADQITVVPDDDTVAAGSSINATITASRDGLGMARISNSAVTWSVYDSNNQYPIATDDVTVTAGVVTVSAMAVPQTFYLRATSIYDNSVYGYARMTTTAGKQFEITNIGVDSVDERQLVRIYANKLTDYKDDVVFLMTFYDENGKLVGAYSKKANAKNLAQGENEIVIDYTLPEAYNKETGAAKVMAWTSLTTNEEPEGISGSFSASYANGTVTLSNAPSVSGTTTVAVFDSTNEAVYQAQSDSAVTSVNVGTLEAGTYTLTLGGAVVDGSYVTYKATFEVN